MRITKEMLTSNRNKVINYSNIIMNLRKEIPKSGNFVLDIQFSNDNEIIFIDPMFFIQLLKFNDEINNSQKYKEQDIRISINIENLATRIQHNVLTYLTQFIDCNALELIYKGHRMRGNTPFSITDKKILLYFLVKENNLSLLEKKAYNFLPIVKITNNQFIENFVYKKYWLTDKDILEDVNDDANEDVENKDRWKLLNNLNRENFYNSLNLDTSSKTNIEKKEIWKEIFETYLPLSSNGSFLMQKFQEIFSELVNNIQKHTLEDDKSSNGYISFYRDTHNVTHNQFEFVVSDDYKKGFLKKYLETAEYELTKEKNKIAIENYKNIISDINKKKYTIVLANIFNLEYVFSSQSERIVKHFGIPLLLKIVLELERLSISKFKKNYVVLEIYVNYYNESFLITFTNGISRVTQLEDNTILGTTIYLSFPEELNYNNFEKNETPLVLKTQSYKNILEDSPLINRYIDKFQYLELEDIYNKNRPNKESIRFYYQKDKGISEFLRKIYSYAFLYRVKDILIINFPIKDYLDYLSILIDGLDVNTITNLVFLDNKHPQAFFIGGKNKNELMLINDNISKLYNYNKINFINTSTCRLDSKIDIDSNLFYTNKSDEQTFIPFELFLDDLKTTEFIYTKMLDEFIEDKNNNIEAHIDLRNGFHVNKFYYLNHVFENSQWLNLISFDLGRKIKNELVNENETDLKDVIFVSLEKYTSNMLSVMQFIHKTSFEVYVIDDMKNEKIIEQFKSFVENNKEKKFIFFRSVVFECPNIEKLLIGINKYKLYCAIKLASNSINSKNWESIYTKDISCIDSSKCIKCNSEKNVPLYKIDDDKYSIKNIYTDEYSIVYCTLNQLEISWRESLFFGHVYRNTNHYLYYVKTIKFFKNNYKTIKKFFSQKLITETNSMSKRPVILAPNHTTNSELITFINNLVFNNDAIIHTFSLEYKNQVFYSLSSLTKIYEHKSEYYDFYFVDDEISSGETLEFFYNILNKLSKDNKFKAVFTLIDRTTKQDKDYILSKYYNKIYSFTELHIHPIKSGFEDCYLCKRHNQLIQMKYNTALLFSKNTIDSMIERASARQSLEVEYETIDQITDFKNYLKFYSTEYIYQNINSFTSIENELAIFIRLVEKYFQRFFLKGGKISKEIRIIIKFEAKIAFLKSLTFPKILFFESLREKVHDYIYLEILDFTSTDIEIKEELDENNLKNLTSISDIENIVNYYKKFNRTNIDYFNFLISTASFIGINLILSEKVITFYYKLTVIIKNKQQYNKFNRLLRVYPISTTQICFFSKDKSKLFHDNLKTFYQKQPFQYIRKFSRIFGLYVENSNFIDSSHIKLDKEIGIKNNIVEKINTFKENLKELILYNISIDNVKNQNERLEILSFYIDIKKNKKNPKLVDILNSYVEVESNSYSEIVYKGGTIKNTDFDNEMIDIEYLSGCDSTNIWCNFYKDSRTYVRVSDNNFVPLGVLVVKHNDTLLRHLKISRTILSKQNEIIEIFNNNEIISSIINNVDEITRNKHKIAKASHGAKDNLNLAIYKDFDNRNLTADNTFYNLWVAFCNIKIGDMYLATNYINSNTEAIDNFTDLKRFIKYLNSLESTHKTKVNNKLNGNNSLNMSSDILEVFLTLLVENAVKHSRHGCNIEISYIDDVLLISNSPTKLIEIDYSKINKYLTIEPHLINAKQGITLFTINKYLSYHNYKLTVGFNEKEFIIKILKKEQNEKFNSRNRG